MTDNFFQYRSLNSFLSQSLSLRLLRSGHAAMSISFLHKVFRQANVLNVPYAELAQKLADYLANIGFLEEGEELQTLTYISSDYYERADTYLKRWADEENRYIFINMDEKTHEPYVTLSRHTEKVFQALELMRDKDFVGTESKLIDLFTKVEELVQRTNEDPEQRIRELQEKKKQVEDEIKLIKQTGEVSVYEPWQIKSRWAEIERLSNELSGDFREVEENFKEIYKTISHRHADATLSKGQLLRLTFDALEELKSNDQGKSFYAFWEFLMDDEKQQQFTNMLQQVYDLLDKSEVNYEGRQLLQLKYMLHAAGIKVLETNQLLGYKLSRIVVEKERGNRRKTRDIINQILQQAIQQAEKNEKREIVTTVNDKPNISMPMERRHGDRPAENEFGQAPNNAALSIDQLTDLHKLMDDGSIDKQVLLDNVKQLLKKQKQVTLKQVIETNGCSKGLAELLAYVSLSVSMRNVSIHADTYEDVLFDKARQKYLQVPQIIFS
ncbi:MAG TPA: DUF3375 family protein [Phnomibacter sp.]|nr:DUF3375 family protein [Phnomibacter sp.]